MITLDLTALDNLSIKKIYLGYSGGVDSHVLLDLLYNEEKIQNSTYQLNVIHINHGLHENSKSWATHCKKICENYKLPLHIITVDAKNKKGNSPEATARQARYAAFEKFIDKDACLITAHHQDDQTETLFLQLLRGAGVKGLASMPLLNQFSDGFLLRPLLQTKRSQIENYAKKNKFKWIDDPSNETISFDRNYLRHNVLPTVAERWPHYQATVSRAATHCGEADQLLSEIAEADSQICLKEQNENYVCIDVKKLMLLSGARQKNVLRDIMQRAKMILPNTVKLQNVIDTVLTARHDARPLITWKNFEIRRFNGLLYFMKRIPEVNEKKIIQWDLMQSIDLPNDLGVLRANVTKSHPDITIRFRQGGEKMCLNKKLGHQLLKKLWQQWGVPPWLRNIWPLIYHGEQLVLVPGLKVAHVDENIKNILLTITFETNKMIFQINSE